MSGKLGRRPSGPFPRSQQPFAFRQTPRYGQYKRHSHIGGVFGQHPGSVGHGDAPLPGRGQVDIVDPVAIIGDQFQAWARPGYQVSIDRVGDRGHQHISLLHGGRQRSHIHRGVINIQTRVEQL